MDDVEGLPASDVLVLQAVREDGPVTRRELNEAVSVADSTVGKALVRLRDEGLVERRPNPADARGYLYDSR